MAIEQKIDRCFTHLTPGQYESNNEDVWVLRAFVTPGSVEEYIPRNMNVNTKWISSATIRNPSATAIVDIDFHGPRLEEQNVLEIDVGPIEKILHNPSFKSDGTTAVSGTTKHINQSYTQGFNEPLHNLNYVNVWQVSHGNIQPISEMGYCKSMVAGTTFEPRGIPAKLNISTNFDSCLQYCNSNLCNTACGYRDGRCFCLLYQPQRRTNVQVDSNSLSATSFCFPPKHSGFFNQNSNTWIVKGGYIQNDIVAPDTLTSSNIPNTYLYFDSQAWGSGKTQSINFQFYTSGLSSVNVMFGLNRDIHERKLVGDQNDWGTERSCLSVSFPCNGWTNFYKLLPEINLFQQQSGRLIDVGKDSVSFSVKATNLVSIGFLRQPRK